MLLWLLPGLSVCTGRTEIPFYHLHPLSNVELKEQGPCISLHGPCFIRNNGLFDAHPLNDGRSILRHKREQVHPALKSEEIDLKLVAALGCGEPLDQQLFT